MTTFRSPSAAEKVLLKTLGQIQDLAGNSRTGYLDNMGQDRYSRVIIPLDAILKLCIDTRGEYTPEEDW